MMCGEKEEETELLGALAFNGSRKEERGKKGIDYFPLWQKKKGK